MTATEEPLLVFDGDCAFCRRWIARWRALTRGRVACEPYQTLGDRFPEIPRERFAEAVAFRGADGTWSHGAEAVFRATAAAPGRGFGLGLWVYRALPPFAAATEWAYRWVAKHR